MLCQIAKGEAYMDKKWSKSFRKCWVWQRRTFVGAGESDGSYEHENSKFATRTIGWTYDPASWPGVVNRDVRGYSIQIGLSTITTELLPERCDRMVLVSLQKSTAKWWNGTSAMFRRHSFGPSFFTSLISIIMTWCPLKKFLHTPLSGTPQKYFQSSPALAKAGPVYVCIFTVKLCHEFAFSLSRKSCDINHLTISGFYPVNLLTKMLISGYIRYPDSKNYWYPK